MLKVLIFLSLLVGSSFFLIEVYSLEVEFQKENERIMESKGWLEPERMSYQEQIQVLIDYTGSKNRISVSMLSKDPNDLRFPDYIENIMNEPKILSFVLTNEYACAPLKTDRACVILDVEREGLGDNVVDIRNNAREITDRIVSGGVIMFAPEFDSVTLKQKTNLDGEKIIVARTMYTINKPSTSSLSNAIFSIVLSADIRESGGFYDHAVKLAENHFSALTITLIPQGDTLLRSMQVSLACSDTIREFVQCPENVSEQITNGKISPLDFIGVENINRSKMHENEFLPLNSIIKITIFSEEDLEIKSVNTNLIEKLDHIGDIQSSGWIFSESSHKIDGRYLFGQDSTVNKNDLVFSFGPNTNSPIDIRKTKDTDNGGCLIATAAFGSEMAPQVQLLREIRDNTVLQTGSGSAFMVGFNQFYYSFSPAIADYERDSPAFKEAVKLTLTPLLMSLTLLQYIDIDSESEMVGYGIGIILLNIGMYFVAPAILIMKIKKRI